MADGFNINDLTDFEHDLLSLAQNTMPKESKKFLNKEGTVLRKDTLKYAKSKVKKETGNYFKGIKKGKVYKYNVNGALSIRVYGASPHAHLIEYGHKKINKSGEEVGFVQGKHIFEKSANDFENKFYEDTEQFLDNLIEGGL